MDAHTMLYQFEINVYTESIVFPYQ